MIFFQLYIGEDDKMLGKELIRKMLEYLGYYSIVQNWIFYLAAISQILYWIQYFNFYRSQWKNEESKKVKTESLWVQFQGFIERIGVNEQICESFACFIVIFFQSVIIYLNLFFDAEDEIWEFVKWELGFDFLFGFNGCCLLLL